MSTLDYRAEIDGLRAVAVLAVIAFHADPGWLPGGYVGVDIFFVISGYLITRIVDAELQAQTFSARQFFVRRIRRLAPALLLVLGACLLPAWYLLLPQQLSDFAGSLWAVSALVANLFFWRQTGYFNAGAEHPPLLHTWSLSVEEQYYLLFALAFPLLWRQARRHLAALLLGTALLSLLASDIASRLAPALAFYALPFRVWELLAGALLALLVAADDGRLAALQRHGQLLGWLGAAVLALALLAFDQRTPFPSLYALLPVLGTLALLVPQRNDALVLRALRWPPLVAIGLVSYSAYLWHQPVFSFAALAREQPLGHGMLGALVLVVFGLAALSWRLVEQPLRRTASHRSLAVVVLLGLLVINGSAWWLRSNDGAPGRLDARALRLLDAAQQKNPRQLECLARPDFPILPQQACIIGAAGIEPTLAVLGDSHADALFVALDRALGKAGLAARFVAHSGCPPVPGLYRSDSGLRSPCDSHQRAVRQFLADDQRIDSVIVVARWSAYLEGTAFDNGEGGRTIGPALRVDPLTGANPLWRTDDGEPRRRQVAALFSTGIETLLDGQRRVVLVYPIPEVGWNVPERLARRVWRGEPAGPPLSTAESRYLSRNRGALDALDAVDAGDDSAGKLLRIRPASLFCGQWLAQRCSAELDGEPLYYDDNHLNTSGATWLAARITAALDRPASSDRR